MNAAFQDFPKPQEQQYFPPPEFPPRADNGAFQLNRQQFLSTVDAVRTALIDPELPQGAKALFSYYLEYSFAPEAGGLRAGSIFSPVEYTSRRLHADRHSIILWKRALVKRGYIWVHPFKTRNRHPWEIINISCLIPQQPQGELFDSRPYPMFHLVSQYLRFSASVDLPTCPSARNGTAPSARNGTAPSARNGTAPSARNGTAPSAQTGTVNISTGVRTKESRGLRSTNLPTQPPSEEEKTFSQQSDGAAFDNFSKWKSSLDSWFPTKLQSKARDLTKKLADLQKDKTNFERELHPDAANGIAEREKLMADEKTSDKRRAQLADQVKALKADPKSYYFPRLKNGPRQVQANLQRQMKAIQDHPNFPGA